jgi:hypothetical protein
MKKSNVIFASLFSLLLLLVIGSNLVLKAEYDSINFNDPFYGYSPQQIQPFQVVHLVGHIPGVVKVIKGDGYKLHVWQQHLARLQWQLKGDTLEIRYLDPEVPKGSNVIKKEQGYLSTPMLFVTAPSLRAVETTCITYLSGWQEEAVKVTASVNDLYLEDNAFQRLSLTHKQGSQVTIRPSNQISSALISLHDSSGMVVEKDVFDSVRVSNDQTARINVPMSVLQKMTQEQQ